MLQLAVFLGNPGPKYENNRHNAGRMVGFSLPFFQNIGWQNKFKGFYACEDFLRIQAAAETANSATDGLPAAVNAASTGEAPAFPAKIHFLMPQTYMNISGQSAAAAASFYKIKLNEIIVIHDEVELPFGTLSLKFSGGLSGHNGLRSIKGCFGSADFWRLRVGIGRPDGRIPGKGGSNVGQDNGIADWALSDFTADEAEALVPVFETGAKLLATALTSGPEKLLPEWAKKKCLD